MSAKHKLNAANINGCLVMAGIFGAAAQSWMIFLILLVVFIGLSVHSKSIRL
mgnify:CR=1 FL=1